MQVEVDPAVCEANGVCTVLAPQVFELDDEDVLHIHLREPSAEVAERVVRAVANCPRNALRVTG